MKGRVYSEDGISGKAALTQEAEGEPYGRRKDGCVTLLLTCPRLVVNTRVTKRITSGVGMFRSYVFRNRLAVRQSNFFMQVIELERFKLARIK